jgi:hypothetical protein
MILRFRKGREMTVISTAISYTIFYNGKNFPLWEISKAKNIHFGLSGSFNGSGTVIPIYLSVLVSTRQTSKR